MKHFRRYVYIMIVATVTIITFIESYNSNIKEFNSMGEAKQLDLNNSIKRANDFIQIFTQYGNDFLEYGGMEKDKELYSFLQYNSDLNGYNLDKVGGTNYEPISGNITGIGSIPESGIQKDEINLAIGYNEFFSKLFPNLPDAAWMYYTSKNNFVSMYPWIPSKDFSFSEKLKNVPFFTAVIPENDPQREAVWTPVYLDEVGKGLMVSLSGPIYCKETFMGAVSIDLTTNTLSKQLQCQYDSYLMDTTGLVIATDKNVQFSNGVMKLNEVMLTSESYTKQIQESKSQSVQRIGLNYIYTYDFDAAPWTMVMTLSIFEVIGKAFVSSMPILMIGILFLFTYKEMENRKKAEEKIKNIAITDELTGLKNRYFLDSVLETELERSDRYNQPLSVIILDLDHFKRVNDTWGHPIGDEVLKQTADITRTYIRKNDVLVRLGGEEFLILLPHTDSGGAFETAEKIRKGLEERVHPIAGKCTASFGVVERAKWESFISLYKRADDALYNAKEGGRNCTVKYDNRGNIPIATVRLEWNNEWNSGDQLVDEQHRSILVLANSLMIMSFTNEVHEKIAEQVDTLLQHIIEHFAYEENLQSRVNYPQYVQHATLHQSLLDKALHLKESYQRGEVKSSVFFSFMVDDVITGHMLQEDVRFFPYVQKANIECNE